MKLLYTLHLIKIFIQDALTTKGFQIYFSSPHPEYRSIGLDCSQYYEYGFMTLHLYYFNIVLTNDSVEHKFDSFHHTQEALFNIIKLDPYLHLLSPDFTTRFIAEQILKHPTSTIDTIRQALYAIHEGTLK
jgi:hypothetical protein